MDTLPAVLALAIAWHIGLALLERRFCRGRDRPSLVKLLLLAEVELLRTLHGELKRHLQSRHEHRCEQKLDEIEERLKELSRDETESDV